MTVAERELKAESDRLDPAEREQLVHDSSRRVRRTMAARADATEVELMELASDVDRQTRQAVVTNPACPPTALRVLLDDEYRLIRWEAIQHPRADLDLQRTALARGTKNDRWALAQVENLPVELEDALLLDEDWEIRAQLPLPFAASDRVLSTLMQDPNPHVRASVASRDDRLTNDQLRTLAQDARSEVRATVASSHLAPISILEMLARDRAASVRWVVAMHQRNAALLSLLFEDVDPDVARSAHVSATADPVPIQRSDGGWDVDDGTLHRAD